MKKLEVLEIKRLEMDYHYQLLVPEFLLIKLAYYVLNCPKEIGGFGYVERISDREFRLTKLVLLKRKTSAVSVEPAPEAYAEYVTQEIPEGKEKEEIGKIRFYWHSHPGMSPYPSLTDEESIKNLSAGRGWIIWMIINQKGEYVLALESAPYFRIPLEIVVVSREEEIKKEIQEKILGHQEERSFSIKEILGMKS